MSRWLGILVLNVAITAVLLAVIVGAVEAYLRATIPGSSGGSIFEYTLSTKRYKVMKPDARIVAWGSEFRTNRLGFRDSKAEVPAKRDGQYRIVVLGDSFTASAGVDFDRIYTTLVEVQLKRRFPGATVLNLAVGGYNIIQYRLVYEEVARALQPDLVLVAVFPFNDLSNDTYRANFAAASGRATTARTRWYENLYSYRAYGARVESRLRALVGPHEVRASAPTADAAKGDNLGALLAVFDEARADGTAAVAVLLPNTDTVEQQRSQFAPFVAFCRDHDLPCLNLLDVFSTKHVNAAAMRLNALDSHPNQAYHVVVADSLTPYLTKVIEDDGTPRQVNQ